MKKFITNTWKTLMILTAFISILSCSDDDDDMPPNIDPPSNPVTVTKSIEYDLGSKAVPSISGKAIFKEYSDNSVTIELDLMNTPAGGQHPAHIHYNTAADGGDVALTLGTVDGDTGKSEIAVTALNDGTAINYDQLVAFDGYINVHLSSDELQTIVAQGDIGMNDLTGASKSYNLSEKAVMGIDGTVTFYERVNGESLSVIELNNTPEGGVHPAHIHFNSAVEGGGIAVSLVAVDGTTGTSSTNIASLNDGTNIEYADLLDFDGYINVHLSGEELNVIVGQGDIGQNELTGSSVVYGLSEKAVPGISGEVEFFERKSGEALAIMDLNNTPAGGSHPAHIHNNDAATGGGIAFTFNPVNGDNGRGVTHVGQLDDGTSLGYENIKNFNGYINVHLSSDDLSTIVAQGNIGSNVGSDGGSDGGSGGGSGGGNSYAVSNSGATAYLFTGGNLENESNPDFTFKRGETYTINVNAPGHPFMIKTSNTRGTGDTYDEGVTTNGIESGIITFTVPAGAPDTLYYVCEFHSAMAGTINIVD